MEMGSYVSDKVTGFGGIVIANVQYITGCNQCLVQPRVKSDGEYVESRWIDEDRLVRNGTEVVTLPSRTVIGPDREAPRR